MIVASVCVPSAIAGSAPISVFYGESGTGKSTLCNVLAGEKHDSNIFPASPYASGRTHCTSIHTDAFFAGDNLKPFTIIDTQGFNDPGKVGSQESQKIMK